MNDALARIGAQFDTEVGPDATILTITTVARFAARGLALLADIVVRPQFDTREFERVRQLRANRLRQLRDMPSALADRAFAPLLYARSPVRAPGDWDRGGAAADHASIRCATSTGGRTGRPTPR